MRRDNKKITIKFILFSLLLIGVVYAILQANLQINGTAKIKANTWDIHFDNIVVNENSVSIGENDSAATIDPDNNCKVDFEVTLSLPGDFYEFTIDVINAGTIDGMIGELNKTLKVNGEAVSEIPNYLDYSVTYSDGLEIEENHKISVGTTETFLVRLEYKTDIEELPEATIISTSLTPQYIQADSSAIRVDHEGPLYKILRLEYESPSGYVQKYDGSHKDSFTDNGSLPIYHWYAANGDNNSASTILDRWNVIFGGFCWQMFRTTDIGGVKLIYNGVPNSGKCTSIGTEQQIGASSINENYDALTYSGYMTGTVYPIAIEVWSNWQGGPDVNYENGFYTIISKNNHGVGVPSNPLLDLDFHRYSCGSFTTTTCSSVRYLLSTDNYMAENNTTVKKTSYITLENGEKVEDVLKNSLENNLYNSTMKLYLENWYQNNLTMYNNKIDNIVFCNDRSAFSLEPWDPDNDASYSILKFKNFNLNNDLDCSKITDQFSTNNNHARLTYSIGLMTVTESYLLNNNSLRSTGQDYWLFSPYYYSSSFPTYYYLKSDGSFSCGITHYSFGVRPVIALTSSTNIISGDGSKNNPYIVE